MCVSVPELCETLCSDVLTGVLNAGQQVGDKLVDGAFVLHCSRNTLSNFDFIALTAKKKKMRHRGAWAGGSHGTSICFNCCWAIGQSLRTFGKTSKTTEIIPGQKKNTLKKNGEETLIPWNSWGVGLSIKRWYSRTRSSQFWYALNSFKMCSSGKWSKTESKCVKEMKCWEDFLNYFLTYGLPEKKHSSRWLI